jgi:hypothetical protein
VADKVQMCLWRGSDKEKGTEKKEVQGHKKIQRQIKNGREKEIWRIESVKGR